MIFQVYTAQLKMNSLNLKLKLFGSTFLHDELLGSKKKKKYFRRFMKYKQKKTIKIENWFSITSSSKTVQHPQNEFHDILNKRLAKYFSCTD